MEDLFIQAEQLKNAGKFIESSAVYQRILNISPDNLRARLAISSILRLQCNFIDAEAQIRNAISVYPQQASCHKLLGYVLADQGRIREALKSFQTALLLAPNDSTSHSCAVYCLNYLPEFSPAQVKTESFRWDTQHAPDVSDHVPSFQVTIVPRTRLRIGYVSPDFRLHAVSFFLEPLIDQHDRDYFEVYCYSDVACPDDITTRFMMSADVWIDCTSCTHDELAERIRWDKIDILVDLAGHTRGNRLPVFAKKPAPVQIAWLGYPNTTGLHTMDYRITDSIADPPGEADRMHSEKLIRLPDGFICYSAPLGVPEVSALPARSNGFVTFGSLNNLSKVSNQVVLAWSTVLNRVPRSRLVLKHISFCDPVLAKRTRDLFCCHGIAAERIDTLPTRAAFNEHLALYQDIDIALDTFPYNGTTTTCEALWMGVPVITLRGDRHAARVGASILTQVGLSEVVAETIGEYIEQAVKLSADNDYLGTLRSTLRERMETSPLCDAQRFTQNFESVLKIIWGIWSRRARRGLSHDVLAQEYYNFGLENMHAGRLFEAIAAFKKALRLYPSFADAYNNLGICKFESGNTHNTAFYFKKAIAAEPTHAKAFNNLGKLLLDSGSFLEASYYLHKAIDLESDNPDAWYNLGIASLSRGMFDEAQNQFVEALSLRPDFPRAYNNLGNVLLLEGNISAAVGTFRRALELQPDYREAHSNLLLALQYSTETTETILYNEARLYEKVFQDSEKSDLISAPRTQATHQHRIRIGYVSPDFKKHSVSYFLKSLFMAHDREAFEIFCYASVSRPDKVTLEFQRLADRWCDCSTIHDNQLAEIIAGDQIDILVDCAGHTAENRLEVFLLKPAQVQVTWLGYPGTTGLTAMNYRLTDAVVDPVGSADCLHTETLIRLPGCFLCYKPPNDAPSIYQPYRKSQRVITFGSFNNLAKLNIETIQLWSKILSKVKKSRLLLKNRSFVNVAVRNAWLQKFATAGCDPDIIELLPPVTGEREHLECYKDIDIALDTFPYNGTTTTCEALWMGVPVVALRGDRHVARVGASILTHVGVSELVASSTEEYLEIAVRLAGDREKINIYRCTLRSMMSSTICDAKKFAVSVESVFCEILKSENQVGSKGNV
jgi:predicted O-linked N-acetylglucosamine transferase (SPINDLY family)